MKEIAPLDEPISPERAGEVGFATEVVDADEFKTRFDELAENLASVPTHTFGGAVRARSWYWEFREIMLLCAVYTIKRAVS